MDEHGFPQHFLSRVLHALSVQRRREIESHLGQGQELLETQDHFLSEITLEDLKQARDVFGSHTLSARTVQIAEDLFIRGRVEPVQAMFLEWMNGAKAQVRGEDVPFSRIIAWCQDCEDLQARRELAREARSLCRFLAPFSHATWKAFMAAITEDLGYSDYISFCQARRKTSLAEQAAWCRGLLARNREEYLAETSEWLGEVQPGLALAEASRFDAIYLLGMRYMDSMFRDMVRADSANEFFSLAGLQNGSGLRMDLAGSAGRQSYCIPIRIPGEVHLILGPVTGWIDWEALFHEMGHAFSFLNTSPALPVEAREFFLGGAVSEAFAFLFQRLCMKRNFLTWLAGTERSSSELNRIESIQRLKFQVLMRRYGAKFLIEFENFSHNRIAKGQDLYARIMEHETGFSYDPETYLFDLMPEFYSLDYFTAFLASGVMEQQLISTFGHDWFRDTNGIDLLREWASYGNLYGLSEFMQRVVGAELHGVNSLNAF